MFRFLIFPLTTSLWSKFFLQYLCGNSLTIYCQRCFAELLDETGSCFNIKPPPHWWFGSLIGQNLSLYKYISSNHSSWVRKRWEKLSMRMLLQDSVHFLHLPYICRKSVSKLTQKNLDPISISPYPNVLSINPQPVNQLGSVYFQSGCNPWAHRAQQSRMLLSDSSFSSRLCCRASFHLKQTPPGNVTSPYSLFVSRIWAFPLMCSFLILFILIMLKEKESIFLLFLLRVWYEYSFHGTSNIQNIWSLYCSTWMTSCSAISYI